MALSCPMISQSIKLRESRAGWGPCNIIIFTYLWKLSCWNRIGRVDFLIWAFAFFSLVKWKLAFQYILCFQQTANSKMEQSKSPFIFDRSIFQPPLNQFSNILTRHFAFDMTRQENETAQMKKMMWWPVKSTARFLQVSETDNSEEN